MSLNSICSHARKTSAESLHLRTSKFIRARGEEEVPSRNVYISEQRFGKHTRTHTYVCLPTLYILLRAASFSIYKQVSTSTF